jgi:hypothetical protein
MLLDLRKEPTLQPRELDLHMMIQEPSKVVLDVLLTHLDVEVSLVLF